MPRIARRESQTGLYHVMVRGNNKNWILKKEKYKRAIVKMMMEQEKQQRIELYGWCIMDNHIHIVLHSSKEKLAKAMWDINGRFARQYNYTEKANGHVFNSRFKSEVIEDERYLLNVIRYVHNNPVKAGIVKKASEYGWSSYRSYIENKMKRKHIDLIDFYFNNNIESFEKFHEQEDTNEYLDTREDIKKQRTIRAQNIIEQYCRKYNLNNVYEIHRNASIRDQMIIEMLRESKITILKAVELTGLSYSKIQRLKSRLGE